MVGTVESISFRYREVSKIKHMLLEQINSIIRANNWNQNRAAEVLGIDQPKISQMKRGRIGGFSLERLLSFAEGLGCSISIQLKYESHNVEDTGVNYRKNYKEEEVVPSSSSRPNGAAAQ